MRVGDAATFLRQLEADGRSIQDALSRFLVQIQADGRSPHTIEQYRRHIGVLAGWLARERPGVEIAQLDHEDIAAFVNAPVARQRPDGRPKKSASMNALRTSLRAFFAYIHAAGWIPQNPARLLRRAITSPGPPRAMADDEVAALLATLRNAKGPTARRDHALIHLLLATGVRLSSALALTVQDVDLERGEFVLRHAKGDRQEVVFLGRKVRDHLARYLRDRTTGVVFPGPSGRRLSRRHAARRFDMAIRAAGIGRPYSPHACRHSFAQRFFARTKDVFMTQAALGHRSIISTAVYARPADQSLRLALANL